VFRNLHNTSVFVHAGRVFAAADNDIPHEMDLQSLDTMASWSVGGDWIRPFTSHPKVHVKSTAKEKKGYM
jgi:carotenoid cleavage dioxygenase-like enzyme